MEHRSEPKGPTPLDRLIARAKTVVAFERYWPPFVAAACVVILFFAISWLGFWVVLPPLGRMIGVGVFALGLVAAAALAMRTRWPSRAEALTRLDRDSGLPHRPLSTSDDALANVGSDPATRAFWDLHRKRQQAAVSRVTVAAPSPRMVDRDGFALRAGVVVVAVAAAFIAGPEKAGRVAAAFAWQADDGIVRGTRIDAWIDPPAYTGKPPLVLIGQGALAGGADTQPIRAPVGSTLIVRAAGDGLVEVASDGGLKTIPPKAGEAPPAKAAGLLDQHLTLAGDGHLRVTENGSVVRAFALNVIPDLPPRIALNGAPKANYRGTLSLVYSVEDDYGVGSAEARFSKPIVWGKPVTGRTLVEPPKGPLALPPMPGGLGEGKTTLDLSDHPWAGAHVTMTLIARDEGGNTGESAPVDVLLPAKPFAKPLARALVEQRRNLVLDPDEHERVATALDALSIAPDAFEVPLGVYLGLHTAELRLERAKTDADLVDVADFLWAMALRIENGDLGKTEQDLRAAQKDLQDAIARNAPPEEIKRLTEALREQMDKFLSEMAQNQQQDSDGDKSASNDQKSRSITEKDLKSMLDRMEQAAKNGDMAEAQRLLDQLNNIMENLRTAKRSNGSRQSQATRDMNRSMNELDRMMREQGDVRDKTFQEGGSDPDGQMSGDPDDGAQDKPGGAPKPGSGKSGQNLKDLQKRQQDLSQALEALQKKLRDLGMKGEQGLADAEEAMKQAEGAMGQGQGGTGDAVEAQGRALEGLQRGANGLGQQMAQGGQDGSGNPAEGRGGDQQAEGEDDLDPLGRPRQGHGTAQNPNLDVSGGLAARAQRVMQELRRRLGDPTRSQDEQDYLERLLKRY